MAKKDKEAMEPIEQEQPAELLPEVDVTVPAIVQSPQVKPGYVIISLKTGGEPVTIHQTQWPIYEKSGKWDIVVEHKKK